jgi:two-component system LytT family sensor kinase
MEPGPGGPPRDDDARPWRRPTWTLGAVLWTLEWATLSLRNGLDDGDPGASWASAIAWSLMDSASWGLLTLGMALVIRRSAGGRAGFVGAAVWAGAFAVGRLGLMAGVAALFFDPVPPASVLLALPSNLVGAIGVAVMVRAVRLYHLGIIDERRSSALRAQLSEAELRMVQMQLQPHFLFNALNSVSALMRRDVAEAGRLLAQLGGLLSLSLERTRRETVALGEELQFVRLYLGIEQKRYADRLRVRFDVADEANGFGVPHLILQPLVENAIRHGVAPHPYPSDLEISARVDAGGTLDVEIRDWGAGLPRRPRESAGLGIPATRARLEKRYGPRATLRVESPADGRGTRVSLRIPPAGVSADTHEAAAGTAWPAEGADPAAPRVEGPPIGEGPRGPAWYVGRFGLPYLSFWAGLAALLTVLRVVASRFGAEPQTFREAGLQSLAQLGSWAVIGSGALLYAARFPVNRRRPVASALGNVAVGVCTIVAYSALRRATADPRPAFLEQLIGDANFSLVVTAAVIGLGHLLHFLEGIRRTEIAASEVRARLSESELGMLQLQLQPSFLFNALSSLSELMRRDVDAADRVIARLGALLRASLERRRRDTVTLKEELEFLDLYLGIERVRHPDPLRLSLHVAPGAHDFPVPLLVLQPLVEAAVQRRGGGHEPAGDVRVSASLARDGKLRLEVQDPAPAAAGDVGRRESPGIAATRARLKQRYHGAASLHVQPVRDGAGSRVTLLLPRERHSPAP